MTRLDYYIPQGERRAHWLRQPRWIYGLFSCGICLYIGQTSRPNERAAELLNDARFSGAKFRLLKETVYPDSFRVEYNFIRRYQRLGQARHNTNLPWLLPVRKSRPTEAATTKG